MDFAVTLMNIRKGIQEPQAHGLPPKSVVLEDNQVIIDGRLESLIHWTFNGDPARNAEKACILTHFNDDCKILNDMVMTSMPGQVHKLLSADSFKENSGFDLGESLLAVADMDQTFCSVMPPHELSLKVNSMVILYKDLNYESGLVMGTRLKVTGISTFKLDAVVVSDNAKYNGQKIILPRVPFTCDLEMGVEVTRIQFPVRPAFAMTVNKAEGLKLDRVGIYLPDPFSDHGELHRAMSRARDRQSLKFLITPQPPLQGFDKKNCRWFTHNPLH